MTSFRLSIPLLLIIFVAGSAQAQTPSCEGSDNPVECKRLLNFGPSSVTPAATIPAQPTASAPAPAPTTQINASAPITPSGPTSQLQNKQLQEYIFYSTGNNIEGVATNGLFGPSAGKDKFQIANEYQYAIEAGLPEKEVKARFDAVMENSQPAAPLPAIPQETQETAASAPGLVSFSAPQLCALWDFTCIRGQSTASEVNTRGPVIQDYIFGNTFKDVTPPQPATAAPTPAFVPAAPAIQECYGLGCSPAATSPDTKYFYTESTGQIWRDDTLIGISKNRSKAQAIINDDSRDLNYQYTLPPASAQAGPVQVGGPTEKNPGLGQVGTYRFEQIAQACRENQNTSADALQQCMNANVYAQQGGSFSAEDAKRVQEYVQSQPDSEPTPVGPEPVQYPDAFSGRDLSAELKACDERGWGANICKEQIIEEMRNGSPAETESALYDTYLKASTACGFGPASQACRDEVTARWNNDDIGQPSNLFVTPSQTRGDDPAFGGYVPSDSGPQRAESQGGFFSGIISSVSNWWGRLTGSGSSATEPSTVPPSGPVQQSQPYNPNLENTSNTYRGIPLDYGYDSGENSVIRDAEYYAVIPEVTADPPAPAWNYDEWVKSLAPPDWIGSVKIYDESIDNMVEVAPSGSESLWNLFDYTAPTRQFSAAEPSVDSFENQSLAAGAFGALIPIITDTRN